MSTILIFGGRIAGVHDGGPEAHPYVGLEIAAQQCTARRKGLSTTMPMLLSATTRTPSGVLNRLAALISPVNTETSASPMVAVNAQSLTSRSKMTS